MFMLLWMLLLFRMLGMTEVYRVLLYLNLLSVTGYLIYGRLGHKSPIFSVGELLSIGAIPFGFIVLHLLAAGNLQFIKEMRWLVLNFFLVMTIWLLARKHMSYVRNRMFAWIVALLSAYVLIQIVATIVFGKPYGTTKNPHYLAQFSALSIPVAIYCYHRSIGMYKVLNAGIIIVLSGFVLSTSSRPAWIALIMTALLALCFMEAKARRYAATLVFAIPAILFFLNIGSFGSRFTELAENISTEERVTIWQDTWRLQETGSWQQWLVGHGMDRFEEDFKPYSRYHSAKADLAGTVKDFNAPHNHFLEVLYTSGILGLMLFFYLLWWLYSRLASLIATPQVRSMALLLGAVLTMHLLFIFITIPFFTAYNLSVLAIVAGGILFLNELQGRQQP